MTKLGSSVLRSLVHLVALTTLAACAGAGTPSDPEGGQTGDIGAPACDGLKNSDNRYSVAETTPLGFSGEDAIDAFDELTAELSWSDGPTANVTATVVHDLLSDNGDCFSITPFDADHPDCYPYLEVPVIATLRTDDDRVDVELPLGLRAFAGGAIGHADYYAADHVGNLDLASFIGSEWVANARVYVALESADGELHGSLRVIGHNEGNDPEQTDVVIATW